MTTPTQNKIDKKQLPSVLAFEKKLVPSDGFMYGTTWDVRKQSATPLVLQEKSVRGTISNRLKKAIASDPLKLDAEVEKANLQRVDACALGPDQDTLKLKFTLKILSNVQTPSACNKDSFQASYAKAASQYIEETGFTELAKRYATNIATGRFLWRNRVGIQQLEINVKHLNTENKQAWVFSDTEGLSLKNFDKNTNDLEALTEQIANALSGKIDHCLLEITAYAQVGTAQDVYPSEELVLDKNTSNKGSKSKILYHVNNVAAMHSQKIGNALRTIDTWYPDADESLTGPIAIEIYGAVTNLGKAYRTPKQKVDFYSLFDQFGLGEKLTLEEQHYVMAVLVRGGVFGESGKE